MRVTRTSRGGFSLVEMLIVALILSIALGMLSMIGRSSERAYQNGTTAAQLEAQVAQAMERVVVELRPVTLGSLPPGLVAGEGLPSIQYVQAVGYEAGAVVETPLRQLGLDHEVAPHGAALSFPIDVPDVHAQMVDRHCVVLPSAGALAGVTLERPEDRAPG